MARKHLLESVTGPAVSTQTSETRADYALRGASRSMKLSIEELADSAKRIVSGETILDLDPDQVDPSPVKDRIDDDEEEFALFLESIREKGQHQPVLVRPRADDPGRYVIVFGRRRVRAAKELGRPVRAIIKSMDDTAHVIAQGQENTRRKDYSFIEKALFAQQLMRLGHPKDVAKAALSVDDTLLSRMLSVTEAIPPGIVAEIGAARTVGRDRWEDLKKLFAFPHAADVAAESVRSQEFAAADSVGRFNIVLSALKAHRQRPRKRQQEPSVEVWTAQDHRVAATYRNTGKTFNLSLSASDANDFGRYISSQLEALYQAFKETKPGNPTGE
jgi:ParB family transcriptional regulator, chromosome partitioning protein